MILFVEATNWNRVTPESKTLLKKPPPPPKKKTKKREEGGKERKKGGREENIEKEATISVTAPLTI